MKGHPVGYSPAEMVWLEAHRTLAIADYQKAFYVEFGRDVSVKNLHALRKRKGWRTGRTGQFVKGSEPVNKGVRCESGTGGRHPNARKTQFRPGNRTGKAAENYRPIGSERVSKNGYRERKIHDGLPMQSRWKGVHRIEWEMANGPVPAGMALKCKGDIQNADPSNWQLIPRSLLPRLNGGTHKRHVAYDDAPDELKPVIMTVARLEHAARKPHRTHARNDKRVDE